MKTYLKLVVVPFILFQLTSCTKDSDVKVNDAKTTLLTEDFNSSTISTTGWTLFSQIGTKNWSQASYKNDGYAQMSSYLSGNPSNVTWLISPPINMDAQQGEKLNFQSCQDGFVRAIDNSLELYVTNNYDATNFANTNWQRLDFDVPTSETLRYLYISSGIIDLSNYTGTLNFAFKYKGTSSQTGGYQVDKVRIFY